MRSNPQLISSTLANVGSVLVLAPRLQASTVDNVLRSALPQALIAWVEQAQDYHDALRGSVWDLVVVSFDMGTDAALQALRDASASMAGAVVCFGGSLRTSDVVAAMRLGADDVIGWDKLADLGPVSAQLIQRGARGAPAPAASPTDIALASMHPMLVLDEHGIVTACNPDVCAVLERDASDLVGRPLRTLFEAVPGGEELLARLQSASDDTPLRDEGWMLRGDGLHMRAELTRMPDIGQVGGPVMHGLIVRDVTLQYRAGHALRQQAEHAAVTSAGRSLFIGSVAHELRAALAPISTSAMILGQQRQPADLHDKLVRIVRRNVKAAARLVEDLLEFSTRTAGKMVLRPTVVDLHQMLVECTESAREQAAASDIHFKLQFGSSPELSEVAVDEDRIRQVITNLLGNALKFTPPGGSVTLRTSGDAQTFRIEVSDTGVGIDPAVLPFIFDPFEQGGLEMTQRHGGFGLGLAISLEIAQQHGGHIVALSDGPGRGTTFRMTLPRHSDVSASTASASSPGLKVLYVEDNADAADAMRYALGTIGWSMLHAPTCAAARELFARDAQNIDVVLADLGLPDGSGLSLGRELGGQVPVVAITAYGAPLALDGFADQLIKPAEISVVQRALGKAVAMHRSATLV